MSYTYASRKRASSAAPKSELPAPRPSMDALRSGAAKPAREQMGHRVDLPDAMRTKMENAFGADLSAVRLYESQAVADAGANAVAQGADIAFAPGMLDFTSYGGQALLGHEISHVVSQARGEVTGSGFLNDHALEARADREGAMAAAGRQIAMPTAALSPVSATSAAGPMQASKWGKNKNSGSAPSEPKYEPYKKIDPMKAGKANMRKSSLGYTRDYVGAMTPGVDPKRDERTLRRDKKGLGKRLSEKYTSDKYRQNSYGNISNGADVNISGLALPRLISELERSMGDGYSQKDIEEMYDNLMAPHLSSLDANDPEAVAAAQGRFDQGMLKLKEIQYNKLKRLEATYGTLGSQMHPADFIRMSGDDYNDHFHMVQDTEQFLRGGGKYFNMDSEKDQDFKSLHDYYTNLHMQNHMYALCEDSEYGKRPRAMNADATETAMDATPITPEMLSKVHGPSMSPEKQAAYNASLRERARKGGWSNRLFRRFR